MIIVKVYIYIYVVKFLKYKYSCIKWSYKLARLAILRDLDFDSVFSAYSTILSATGTVSKLFMLSHCVDHIAVQKLVVSFGTIRTHLFLLSHILEWILWNTYYVQILFQIIERSCR